MKKGVVFLAGLLIAVISVAQNQSMDEINVTPPTFKNELFKSIDDVLNSSVQYPLKSKKAELQGTEVIRFTVSVDGRLSDFQVVNSVSPEIDDEVIRVLQLTNGKWTAGTTNGNAIDMQKEVVVAFKLKSSENFVAHAKNNLEKANDLLFVKNSPEEAIKYYNRGVNYLPHERVFLYMRGLCNYKLGNVDEARIDWDRISAGSNKSFSTDYPEIVANREGNEELSQALKK